MLTLGIALLFARATAQELREPPGRGSLCGASARCGQPAESRIDAVTRHRAAAKAAAGLDFDGTLGTLCVAPNIPNRYPPREVAPERSTWYAEPKQVFDNLYWLGTQVHSSWALKSSDGIILIDTLFYYASEPEIIDGLKKLGLDPASIKYVIISHGHGDHDEGARLLQERYGAHIVMGGPDWDLVEKNVDMPGGKPRRDVVGMDGQKITLGDTSVTLVATPGHTPGTLSLIFRVFDHGKPLTVAYSGGTAFNFPHTVENYDTYIASQRKMAKAAAEAGASILMSNHSQFDGAFDKVMLAQLRKAGAPHPFEIGTAAVQRYFKVGEECAEAARIEVGGSSDTQS